MFLQDCPLEIRNYCVVGFFKMNGCGLADILQVE